MSGKMNVVTCVQEQNVAVLTLQAPPMNVLGEALVLTLEQVLAQCQANPAVHALVLQGAGHRAFSTGSDLQEIQSRIEQGKSAVAAKFERDARVFGMLASFGKPTVCALEGLALGGGLELASCCDFIVVGQSTRLGLPEIKLGAFPGSGGTLRITQRIGLARARRMMLLGEPIDTATALAWGLVDEVVADGSAQAAGLKLAHTLAASPQDAIRGCKLSLQAAVDGSPELALALAQHLAVELAFSEDLKEGLQAFREKRPAVFGS